MSNIFEPISNIKQKQYIVSVEEVFDYMAANFINIREAVIDFLYFQNAKNNSKETIKTYLFHINLLIKYYNSQNESSIEELCTEKNYYDFILYLNDCEKIRGVSVNSYARSIKTFFNFCINRYAIPRFEMKLPKYQKTIPDSYSDKELGTLLEKPRGSVSKTTYITWVMIVVLCFTGMRLSSLTELKVGDVKFDNCEIVVNSTKNKRPILIPANKALFPILMEYISIFKLEKNDYLFCTAQHKKYLRRTVESYVASYEAKKGIFKHRLIHAFRHTFSANYYRETNDVLTLMKILGHSSLNHTYNYLESLGFGVGKEIELNPLKFVDEISGEDNNKKTRRGKIYLSE